MVLCGMFAALVAIGAFIQIPVPYMDYFTLQFFFVLLAGLILGADKGAISVGCYVLLGLVGVPIFAAGGGIGYIFRPSFGYLVGFIVSAYVTGKVCEKLKASYKNYLLACLAGFVVTYAIGIVYKFIILNFYAHTPATLGVIFLSCFPLDMPGDFVLCLLAAGVGLRMRKKRILSERIKKGHEIMAKGIFVTGTGTDVGKTYVTALIVKKLADAGIHAGYYKAALSGAESIEESDAGYVKKIAGITQEDSSLLSYLYQNAVSPHLAARIEGNPVDPETVKADFDRVKKEFDYVTVEGSGGIVCPIRWDEEQEILLEDIVKMLHLNTLVIADAGLGTINAVVLTVEYIRNHGMDVKGIILNHYSGGAMQEDNEKMIERLTGVPVIARVRDGDRELEVDLEVLKRVYD